MHYRAIKTAPLNLEERQRLRIAIKVERALRHPTDVPDPCRLTRALSRFLHQPGEGGRHEWVAWLFAYGTPRLLLHLMQGLDQSNLQRLSLRALCAAGPASLLPREYITPDLQIVQNQARTGWSLVCFAGSAQKLNIPIQLFHCLLKDRFDTVVYVRDQQQALFTRGLRGISDSLDALPERLLERLPALNRIAVLGASGGGLAATRFAEAIKAARLALFSSPFHYEGHRALQQDRALEESNVRMFYAREHARDRQFAEAWQISPYAAAVRWLNTDTHGTLRYLYTADALDALLDWLAGADDTTVYAALPAEYRDDRPQVFAYI